MGNRIPRRAGQNYAFALMHFVNASDHPMATGSANVEAKVKHRDDMPYAV